MGAFKIHRGRPISTAVPFPPDATVVHNATELTAAIRSGADGTHYVCAPGDYGAFDPGFQPRATRPDGSAPVHVWGQAGVTFTSINIGQGKFIHFHYITANGSTDNGFTVGSSVDIAFDHCKASNVTTSGFSFRDTANPAVTWCKVDTCAVGFAFVTGSGVLMADCLVEKFSADAFDMFGVTTATVSRCMSHTSLFDPDHQDAFQLSNYNDGVTNPRCTDITLTDINFDRNGGTQTNGPVFVDHCDRLTYTNIASFGSNNNGASLSDVTNSTVTNGFFQSYDFAPIGIIRGGSVNCSLNNVKTNSTAIIIEASTGCSLNSCATIAQAADLNDRALYNAFLAANPTIPTPSHWASAGYV